MVGSALAHEREAVRVQWVWGGVVGVGRVVVRVGGCVVGGHFILGGCWRKVVWFVPAWRKWAVVWNLDLRGGGSVCDGVNYGTPRHIPFAVLITCFSFFILVLACYACAYEFGYVAI